MDAVLLSFISFLVAAIFGWNALDIWKRADYTRLTLGCVLAAGMCAIFIILAGYLLKHARAHRNDYLDF